MTAQLFDDCPGGTGPLCRILAVAPGRLEVHGELDIATSPELLATGRDHASPNGLVIDLTNLLFVDAAGVNALIGLNLFLAENRHRLVVVGSSARIVRTFRIARAEWVLNLRPQPSVLERLRDCAVRALHARDLRGDVPGPAD